MLKENNVRKEELKARAVALKTLGKIFQVQFFLILMILIQCNSAVYKMHFWTSFGRTSKQRMLEHQGRRTPLTQTTMGIVLTAVAKTIHQGHFPIELLYSFRHVTVLIKIIDNALLKRTNILWSWVNYFIGFYFLIFQGIGRLFRCLCNPAFDVDDDEIIYKSKWCMEWW